jgi:hypothetical protein
VNVDVKVQFQAPCLPHKKAAATTAAFEIQVRHQSQPNAIHITPATQKNDPYHPKDMCAIPAIQNKCKYQIAIPSTIPVTQKAAATMAAPETQVRHQSQPSAIHAPPVTQSHAKCHCVCISYV